MKKFNADLLAYYVVNWISIVILIVCFLIISIYYYMLKRKNRQSLKDFIKEYRDFENKKVK